MQEEEPQTLYVHCMVHVLNLVLQDMCHKVNMCHHFLSMVTELISFVTSSPKRVGSFQVLQVEDEATNLRRFCPTRWTLRGASLRSVLVNYKELIAFFRDRAHEERNDAEQKRMDF